MSSKFKHSALCQGWSLTYVCKNVLGATEVANLPMKKRFLSCLVAALLTMCWVTTTKAQCTLTCDDQKQISLGTSGYAKIIPELVLNGDFSCAGPIVVQVFDVNNQPIGDTVRCEHIGQTLQVLVSSATIDAECSSLILIEDKLAPRISCRDTIIACNASVLPSDIGFPVVMDNCNTIDSSDLRYFDTFTELSCGTMFNGEEVGGRITRSWTVLDAYGNLGTCTQSIYLRKANINDVVFPQHRDDASNSSISCTINNPSDPSVAGQPTLYGLPMVSGGACKFFVAFQEQRMDVCPPASYRIIRRWEVTDVCTEEVRVGIQNILIVDKDPPIITCPDSFSVVSSLSTCGATVFLPQASATDSCSSFTIQPSWEFGTGYGPFNDVPVGVHTITYTATDQCGNSSTCTTKVSVIDNSQPVAICKDELFVALSNDGFAEVQAVVFDGGSRDNCGVVRWQVTRNMDVLSGNEVFGDSIRFTCDDIGQPVQIRLKVFDTAGLSNECTMFVNVADEARPTITFCPANITLNCAQNFRDTVLTGAARAVDNCEVASIYYSDSINVNSCNVGTVIRTWFAVDSSGNAATCEQLIFLEDNTPISVQFPVDYSTNECGADLSPEVTGRPVVTGADCESILIRHRDETFLIGDSACMKILRTWTVLEWCTYDPTDTTSTGRVEKVQVIKIEDNEAPQITACPVDVTVGITEFACEVRVDLPDLEATDCNPNLTISNTSPYADVNGRNASGMYPIGTHTVRYVVTDGCGNISTCEMTVTVEDRHAPTAVCKYGLTISLTAGGFVNVPANAINSGSYDNCSGEDNLTYELSPNYFTCADTGEQVINLIVTDQYGNSEFCSTSIFIQDNSNVCGGGSSFTAIGGRIFTEDGSPMEEVPVQISGGVDKMGYTDDAGSYLFENLSRLSTYTVRPMADENYGEGLSTFDLLLIRKHVLGITPLDSPYKIIAADVNNSGTITSYDMVIIRQVVLGSRTDFPNNTSWKYIDASYQFPDPRNPFLDEVPQFRDYKKLLVNDLERDFIGVKIGDVNNSASPMAMVGGSRNQKETLHFAVEDIAMKAGFEYRVPFKAKDLQTIQGYQFTIDFDEHLLHLNEVISGEPITMGANNFGLQQTANGKVTTSWENAGDVRTDDETVLFTLVFTAQSASQLSEAMEVNSSVTLAEAYNTRDELMNVDLQFINDASNDRWQLHQNRPNPFRGQTTISFTLPTSTEGTISIYDINGKLLKSYYGKYAQGYNEVAVDLSDIHTQTGVLYYHLQTPVSKRLSKKMVLIRE